jgi:serine/threonine protein kinase
VVLYELLQGRPPFTEGGPFQILLAHQDKARSTPSGDTSEPGVRARLASVALRALEKNPAARYQSANEMAAAIWRAVSPEGLLPEHLRRAEHDALGTTSTVTVPKPAGPDDRASLG